MDGYTTDYINLITDNLRDRYDNGFPILKELIQNADDAKARNFIFAHHGGFPDAAHPLLNGPGLWFFNDGRFEPSDARALRSFGINSKAGDAAAIGKFGLGMKSVFHLCEALFYLAWDGRDRHAKGLNPWKQDDRNPHPEWDQDDPRDWELLQALAEPLAQESATSWFLLWVPLRRRAHLRNARDEDIGAIIARYPGDDTHSDLKFLNDPGLALDLATILPLLRHLERIQHQGKPNAFTLELKAEQRLLGDPGAERSSGQVVLEFGDSNQVLRFAGMGRQDQDPDQIFSGLKARAEWPRSRYRDESGHERPVPDKTRPEAAVLFCSEPLPETRSNLHWAVFLPVEQGGELFRFEAGNPGHSLILHGQFFIDAGRKKPHALEDLHCIPKMMGAEPIDDSLLRRTWNQHLAQRVLLPLVIPALEHYVTAIHLTDAECKRLAQALAQSGWFQRFKSYVCRSDAWYRTLEPDAEPRWNRIGGLDLDRLRPLPAPPKSALQRPWQVFPRLKASGLLLFDADAPSLSIRQPQWQEPELDDLLGEVTGLFTDGPRMEYLTDFIEKWAGPFLKTERLQLRLITLLRARLITAGRDGRRQHAEKSRRLFGFVEPMRRLTLAADLPESVLRDLWSIDRPLLLIPQGLEPEITSNPEPSEDAWAAWLRVLDRHLTLEGADADQEDILLVVFNLLKRLDADTRRRFLRVHQDLRIIAIRDARTRRNRAVSSAEIRAVKEAGTLFGFAQGTQEQERLGLTPLLAAVLPNRRIWLVRAEHYRDLFQGEADLPGARDERACLAAVGRADSEHIGGLLERRAFIEHANDPGNDPLARRGLRYLLHGSALHRNDDDTKLWFPGHDQHPAWAKLWSQIYSEDRWSLLLPELADAFAVPRTRWSGLGVHEIDARNLTAELARTGAGIPSPTAFGPAEREEILSKIEDQSLWQRLPLHTTITGDLVSADDNQRVYLAPQDGAANDPLIQEATLIAPSVDNPKVADQQRRWLKQLDHRARIEIVLGTAKPCRYWTIIANALVQLDSGIDADLKLKLCKAPWLPTRSGGPVKPEDVIDLSDGLTDETWRLVTEHREQFEFCFAVPADLDAQLQTHAAWPKLRASLFSSGESGLDRLGLLLADLPHYRIGSWQRPPEPEVVALLAGCPALPGWRLIQQAAEGSFGLELTWRKLNLVLGTKLPPEGLLETLNWLSADTVGWARRKHTFDNYLAQLADHPEFTKSRLISLRLASRRPHWESSTKLCFGANGVDPAWLLDANQAHLLEDLIHHPNCGISKNLSHTHVSAAAAFEEALAKTPETLERYFRPWIDHSIPSPMIGVVMGLLGDPLRPLAEGYLRPFSLRFILQEEFPWSDPGGGPLSWMYRKTRDDLMAGIKVAAQVVEGDMADALNLVGDWIKVPLDRQTLSLLAGTVKWMGGYRASIQLRPIDVAQLDSERLATLLRAAAEQLYATFYNQKKPDLSRLWKQLDRSNQLEIDVARNMILEFLPWYLRQLSLEGAELKKALRRWDTQRLRVEEIRAAGKDESAQRDELSKAVQALADCLVEDPDSQQRVLSAVKAKVSQFEYDCGAIPFELFQNADDATVELGQIAAHSRDEQLPPGAQRFVVEVSPDTLRFLHWGRPVNARGPVEFGGEERGFGRDLEKMLILFESDKEPSKGLTGKFGLGFKSVFLVCDRPRLLSDRLSLEIVAGILPESWPNAQEARDALNRLAEFHRLPGTLIELPGVSDRQQAELLGRFQELAGVLVVFGQAIRSVEMVGGTNALAEDSLQKSQAILPRRFTWKPSVICRCVEVEYGQLAVAGEWGTETGALCVRSEHGALLMALGPDGFRALPDRIPTLWVTAPTKEKARLGFALNGRFAIDAGRTKLPGNDRTNLDLAQNMGAEVGEALSELFDRSRADWGIVRRQLGLAADLTRDAFWRSIWLGLTEQWLGKHRDAVAALAREFVLALLRRLTDRRSSIPNGLAPAMRTFTSIGEARYELPKLLAEPAALELLNRWSRFVAKYPAGSLVGPEIGAILKHADLASPKPIGLVALVAVIDPPRVEPADADVLGRLWCLTEEDGGWDSKEVRERLDRLQFRTEDGGWAEAGSLLVNESEIERDEVLRYAIAPPSRRLHRDYCVTTIQDAPPLAFFRVCRARLQAPFNDLARWVQAAQTDETRHAALVYLADGDFGEAVAERVRGKDWLQGIFQNRLLLDRLSEEQRERLQRRLASREVLDRVYQPLDDWILPSPPPRIDLEKALRNLHAWWSTPDGINRAREYDETLYPANEINLQIDPETGQFDRSSWLILFSLGAFQGMGRTQDAQHRRFIQYCQQKGWWQIFAEIDPKEQPVEWMNIIEEYAESQHDDEQWTQWIAQFPKLYKLRRWMDNYVELFLSIDRFAESFLLEEVLTPRANQHYQGGGIDAPPLIRTLRLGGHLVIRELLRHGVIRNPFAVSHAYSPIERTQRLFASFNPPPITTTAREIYALLCEHLGETGATFNGAYDIPLRIVAGDQELQQSLFR